MAKENDCTESNLVIEFANPKAAQHFKDWLSGQGEQDYWTWMECREQEEPGDITATSFNYGVPNVIRTNTSRLDK